MSRKCSIIASLVPLMTTYDGNFGHGCVYLQITADQNNKMLLYENTNMWFNLWQ